MIELTYIQCYVIFHSNPNRIFRVLGEVNDTVDGVMIGMELGLGHHGGSLHPHNMPQHQMHAQGLMHQQQQMLHDDGNKNGKTDQNYKNFKYFKV